MYSELKLELILDTLSTLQKRIAERFPDSGLSRVAEELHRIGVETGPILQRIRRPNRALRAGIALAVILIVVLAGALLVYMPALSFDVGGIGSLLQVLESAAQNLVFLGLAIYFLLTLEARINRRIALQALHRLRSIVHIVDMHQLTKDPDHVLTPGMSTASSPEYKFTRFELARYLDYSSELLSLASKLAALQVQYVNDPVVLNAVNDVEALAANLSNKIWQKIVILDTAMAAESELS